MKQLTPPQRLGLFFDTETAGIPNWKIPSDDPSQPHMTEIGAIVAGLDTVEIIHQLQLVITTDGWDIPDECVELNGITKEYADKVGVPEEVALNHFWAVWRGSKRIAYNTTFDNRIIRIATKRYYTEGEQDIWKSGKYECMMIASKKHLKVKSVKLEDAYRQICGKELEGAHRAINDAKACMDIYFALNPPTREQEQGEAEEPGIYKTELTAEQTSGDCVSVGEEPKATDDAFSGF